MAATRARIDKVPGPSHEEIEALAAVVPQLEAEGAVLGEWEYEPGDLRIDFVFGDARPRPMAIEVTSFRDSELEAGSAEMGRFVAGLNQRAEAESWEGHWAVVLNPLAQLPRLAEDVAGLIREGTEITPEHYSSDDLLVLLRSGADVDEFLETYRILKDRGLHSLRRRTDTDAPRIQVTGMTGSWPISGFTSALTQAVAGNETKFVPVVETHEKHLVVEVYTWHASREPQRTAVPVLPAQIDRLWVVHRWATSSGMPTLWWANRGSHDWSTSGA